MQTDPIWHRDSIGSLKPMQESSRGADHDSDLCLHVSLYAGNYLEHVRTLLIGYRSGGTPGFLRNLRARDGIAGRRRGSSACQCSGDLPALRVACRCSLVGFDRQHIFIRIYVILCFFSNCNRLYALDRFMQYFICVVCIYISRL